MPSVRRYVSPRLLVVALALSVVPLAAPASTAAASTYLSNCTANVRSKATTSATIKKIISMDTTVTVSAKVSGGWWKADCRSSVSGSSWYAITAINGRSVSSLFGVSALYAATGLFRSNSGIFGLDISSWQGTIDFGKVRGSGRRFVIAKVTEGTTWTDANYLRNRKGAVGAGLRFTGYHYARPGTATGDAVHEADHFLAQLGLVRGMLIPALDLEVSGGLGVSALQSWTKTFVGRVYSRTGVRPMIYTNASFWRYHMGDTSWFANNGYRMWIAQWKVASPSLPASNWSSRSWTFWQYTNCGSVPGIGGCVDLDRFRGIDLKTVTY
jgi:GH25 family lysozyme M1 (1,4-beta-N-acetylmuramidase)